MIKGIFFTAHTSYSWLPKIIVENWNSWWGNIKSIWTYFNATINNNALIMKNPRQMLNQIEFKSYMGRPGKLGGRILGHYLPWGVHKYTQWDAVE